jgi:hypothetical protein
VFAPRQTLVDVKLRQRNTLKCQTRYPRSLADILPQGCLAEVTDSLIDYVIDLMYDSLYAGNQKLENCWVAMY